ncbi:MAG: RIP metalloprotease RseP [Bacteroidia bacterium]|nr:RIP metalloprotease RseP [Bacteroidia bacterium]NNF30989.1 RIP metalloprotease RseP [Flavobacteriaceae bacterium]MBT8274951.1 RIP metalloprotease RseP [Bacteroidia bacterium]NNJ82564.1 RIP metalloprotease RseP [Flavobacteriaceae bacterium]NNK54927.1 RIP metalloprotease RseP [Flavobacteriaceae bacterium]
MSPFAVKAIQLLLSLSILIVLHELGHFIPAKLFKTRVEKFFLFFDVKFALVKKKVGDTVYGIGWLPLGGYVKISGMIDESMDKEQMAQPPQPWEFRSKPAWQRLIIMLGGVTVNIIVGFVIYMGILYFYGRNVTTNEELPNGFAVVDEFKAFGFQDGDKILKVNNEEFPYVTNINRELFLRDVNNITVVHPGGAEETINLPEDVGSYMFDNDILLPFKEREEPVLDTVVAGFPALAAGFKKGDRMLSVNGEKIDYWYEFQEKLRDRKSEENVIEIDRSGVVQSINVTTNENGQIGVDNVSNTRKLEFSLGESITGGVSFGYNILKDYVKQFKYVFTSKGATQIGGFGAIGNLFPSQWSWVAFWQTTALISIILAFMNVLPIPALDGGHVAFLLYEMVTGRKPGDKFLEYAQMVGFFLLIALVLFANGNDIYRWLFK